MKKVNLFATAFVTGLLFVSCSQGGNKSDNKSGEQTTEVGETISLEGFKVNTDESKVLWTGTSLGVYSHTGTVGLSQAELTIENGQIAGGSFTVDLSTMVATDENFNPEEGSTKEKLIGHLSSPDFFDVENHPSAQFTIESMEGNTATGTLTIRGHSHPEKVTDIKVSTENGQKTITGKLVFERKKYDVSWEYPVQDKILKNEIELDIHLIGS
jgi:polyisoprenoid-binding protein YceI